MQILYIPVILPALQLQFGARELILIRMKEEEKKKGLIFCIHSIYI